METKKQDLKRVIIYLLITFTLTWLYAIFLVYPIASGEALSGVPAMATQLVVAAAMFCPAVGVVLTRLVTREGFKNAWLRPHIKGNVKHYLLAWFGPGVLTFAGMGIYFLLFPGKLDLSFSYFTATLESAGAPMETLPMPIGALMLVQCVQALFLAPVMNFVTCFGEEWGWRGYLLPKMQNLLPTVPMLLVTGIIWGLWHAPLTIIGHNYGLGYWGFPFTGIAMMCLFCITLGIFLSFVTLKTGSCIPAIIGHGAVNGIAAIGIYFTHDGGNPFVGPAPTGIIGMIPFLVAAIFMVLHLKKNEKGTA
jgi:membrane protease YdiL (CAAX protease family)